MADSVAGLLAATLHHDNDVRGAAEAKLEEVKTWPRFPLELLKVAGNEGVDEQIRQSAALLLKNLIFGEMDPSDRAAVREALLPTLNVLTDKKVARSLVLCCIPTMRDPEVRSVMLDRILSNMVEHWQRGNVTQIISFVRCLKIFFVSCGHHINLDRTDPQEAAMVTKMSEALNACMQLLQASADGQLHEIQKLLSNVVSWAMSQCELTYMVQPENLGLLTSWIQTFLSILWHDLAEGSDDATRAFCWKSKARVLGAYKTLIEKTQRKSKGDVLKLLIESYDAVIQVCMKLLERPPAQSLEAASQKDEIAFGKCLVAALDLMATDAMARDEVREPFIQPRVRTLFTESLFNLLKLTEADAQIMASDPQEFSRRSAEEARAALSCRHGLPLEFCQHRRCWSLWKEASQVTTPRAAAMKMMRQLVMYNDDAMLHGLLEFIESTFAEVDVQATKNEAQYIEAVRIRLAVTRTFACVADCVSRRLSFRDLVDEEEAEDLLEFPEVAREVSDENKNHIFRIITTHIVRECKADHGPLSAHQRALAVTVVGRFADFMSLVSSEHLQNALKLLIEGMLDVEAVYLNASWNFRDCLYLPQAQDQLLRLIPSILDFLISQLPHPAMLEALNQCFYAFRGKLGAANPETSPGNLTQEEAQQVVQAHAALIRLYVEEFTKLRSILLSEQASSEHEVGIGRWVEAIQAAVMSCNVIPIPNNVVHDLVPFFLAGLEPSMFALITRQAKDSDFCDTLSNLPSEEPEYWAPFLPSLLRTITVLPNAAEMLLPKALDMLLWSGSEVLMAEDEAAAQQIAEMFLQALRRNLVPTSSGFAQCLAADLLCTIILCTAASADESVLGAAALNDMQAQVSPRQTVTRRPFVFLALQQLLVLVPGQSPSFNYWEDLFKVRLLTAVSAAFFVDPMAVLQLLFDESLGIPQPFRRLLTHYMKTGIGLIKPKPALDMPLNALGLSALISIAGRCDIEPALTGLIVQTTLVMTKQSMNHAGQRRNVSEQEEGEQYHFDDDDEVIYLATTEDPFRYLADIIPEVSSQMVSFRFAQACKTLFELRPDVQQLVCADLPPPGPQ